MLVNYPYPGCPPIKVLCAGCGTPAIGFVKVTVVETDNKVEVPACYEHGGRELPNEAPSQLSKGETNA